jgi:hypothetical protein
MSERDEEDDSDLCGHGVESPHVFDPLFGDIEDVRYCVSNEDNPYAVVIEIVQMNRLMLIYEVNPEIELLWVFHSIEASLWGGAMWANNDDMIDVAKVVGEDVRALLVTEEAKHQRILKLLTYDAQESKDPHICFPIWGESSTGLSVPWY